MAADDEMAARDAAILAALYGEAGADVALDHAQQATHDEWQMVRGVVRHAREHGFEVEPSAGLMVSLMAAARAQAVPPAPGLGARFMAWMTPLIAHPALAGAAALVVVGGTAGVLYMRGQRAVRPAAQSQPADPPPAVPSPITEGDLGDVLRGHEPVDRRGPAVRVDDGDDDKGRDRATIGGGQPTEAMATEGGARPGPGAGSGASRGRDEHPAKSIAKPPVKAPIVLDPIGADEGGAAGGAGGARGALQEALAAEDRGESSGLVVTGRGSAPTTGTVVATRPESQPVPAPVAPPPPLVKAPAPRPAQIATDDAEPPTAATRRAQAVKLTDQARAAAKTGACATIAERSRQVAALDPDYHRAVFVRDPDIARCR